MPQFPENKLPVQERMTAWNAYLNARAAGGISTQNVVFEKLANQERQQHFWRTSLFVPAARMVRMWNYLPMFGSHWLYAKIYAALFWVSFSIALAVGTLRRVWGNDGFFLLIACVGGRLVLPLITVLGVEPRYVIVALPSCFVLATLAFVAPGRIELVNNLVAVPSMATPVVSA
jgi:hypothetical protein